MIDRLAAYKKRMGWQFPYVSTYKNDFPFDFGLAMTEEQSQQIPEVKEMIDDPPRVATGVVAAGRGRAQGRPAGGAELHRVRARDRTVYHTYTVMAPDPFVAPFFSFLLDRTPAPTGDEESVLAKDEYPD